MRRNAADATEHISDPTTTGEEEEEEEEGERRTEAWITCGSMSSG